MSEADRGVRMTYETKGDFADISRGHAIQARFLIKRAETLGLGDQPEVVRYDGAGDEVSLALSEEGVAELVRTFTKEGTLCAYLYDRENDALKFQRWDRDGELTDEVDVEQSSAEGAAYFGAFHREILQYMDSRYGNVPGGMEPPSS